MLCGGNIELVDAITISISLSSLDGKKTYLVCSLAVMTQTRSD